ncbi:hypothetical protein DTO013E5_6644 [Penicillium roqueforti]|uniref:Genomic scaffold, ProqFM164S04 n=1 Tax=Penicillium roqueforti (strain FM164) TaxID=1365484 RepID=W6QLW3_PENRF|nr:uncharacterized protein LCP9604111_6692 [Penicillium roqueforti]CDM35199.1 unnamed protein product [Penicillium roqueforti FM164]KAF9246020.1 hypothetical protein LCP9604111_6692 [Penicillium roqueforti]KAI1834504.1 hypothetical protein CBS147337_4794 [Penicillium roqueforti]KAI2685970.1 hypothetical protein CBS147355_1457 [Penicillium roqueforti]KAI2692180.1 hypothetical protein LCP963914a_274 [Penicillium roqueforti]
MRSPSVKPSAYPPLPFHLIRFLISLSSIVTGVILAVFTYHLHADGYKLPYSFLVLFVASGLSLLNIFLTSIIHCSCGLSTKLSISLNILLTILWALSLGLLSWSLASTITTSCTTTYWGNSTGIAVCRSYKALFTFTVIGLVSYIAAVWLDVVVRRRQTRLGVYDPMGSHPGLGDSDAFDVKMDDRHSESTPALHDYDNVPPAMHGAYGHGHDQAPPVYEHNLEHAPAGEAQNYYHDAPGMNHRAAPRVHFSSYDQDGHQRQAENTGYDPAMYR